MNTQVLDGGFADPAPHAARAFRAVMEAMARPGTIHSLTGATPPAPLSVAAAVAILTLCDTDTPVFLAGDMDTPNVRAWIAFHTGAPFSGPATCAFALGRWGDLGPLSAYPIGSEDYPDRSATLIVAMDALDHSGQTLRGPGIQGTARLSLPEVAAFQANHAHFPCGLDFLFTCDDRIAGLPRSTEVS
ncbi:phosphonate C-P lyase system protein PhnH (plasmid) [Pseudorhodobacter turbinis]|uniref:Phosphonate C-P lyase system protein PhnH n=1 Tax=Pseudorhodobacter turbinis TaxID=2500533 RepID=A0A4P8EKE6_9RHOB|nr:phosphonate C-P lyase system protein PhnH [Pseudorhodobacter turbinis]QCO57691.1 phosphonate C-P lyase system protein PhnH [Pseudorhodobacter turbinis]